MDLAKNEQYAEARQIFEQLAVEEPKNAEVLNMLAYTQRKTGDIDEAIANYGRALKIKPKFPQAREYLAEAYLQAALREAETLKGYGGDGRDELRQLADAFQAAASQPRRRRQGREVGRRLVSTSPKARRSRHAQLDAEVGCGVPARRDGVLARHLQVRDVGHRSYLHYSFMIMGSTASRSKMVPRPGEREHGARGHHREKITSLVGIHRSLGRRGGVEPPHHRPDPERELASRRTRLSLYRKLVSLAGDDIALEARREFVRAETEHVDEVRQMLRKPQ